MKRINTIIRKEWAEVFKNRWVLFSIIFLPLVFCAIPLAFLFITSPSGASDLSSDLPAEFAQLCGPFLSGAECFQIYMIQQFLVLFLMTPLIIPINIAAYSIVGEKSTHSLEPLLATPITTAELLSGKNLAAVIPATLATWGGFGLFALGAALLTSSKAALSLVLNPVWLTAILILGPLMAVMSVNFCMMVSSRVNDPRAAEQISTVIILPVLLLFLGQITGFFILNKSLLVLLILIVIVLDLGMVYLATQFFQRETILTRWK
jgi:ABC-2 type transport system permease protein